MPDHATMKQFDFINAVARGLNAVRSTSGEIQGWRTPRDNVFICKGSCTRIQFFYELDGLDMSVIRDICSTNQVPICEEDIGFMEVLPD